MTFEFHHARGETDDETWVWQPDTRVLCTGRHVRLVLAQRRQPVQGPALRQDWADALEEMAALKPAHLLPGHGPAMSGEGQIEDALLSTAHFLRSIHDQVVAGMNEGKWLEDIMRDMDWPATDKPWLRPIYDHPQFIARNVYRLYGGWWDGDAANMLPAHPSDVAAALIGATGSTPILDRARAAQAAGDLQLACHLTDFVRRGEPDNREAWELWRDLFTARSLNGASAHGPRRVQAAVRDAEAKLKELG